MRKYRTGQTVRSTVNRQVYRVEKPLPGVYELHLIQWGNGEKLPYPAIIDYSSEDDQYLEPYQENA